MLAFLLCRVLDAYEDLSPSPEYAISALRRIVAGLAGKEEIPPLSAELISRNQSDAVESLLASKLELLRQLFMGFPEQSQSRVLDLVSRMASAMEISLRKRSAGSKADLNLYCDSVLGNATSYAFRILTGQEPYERGRKAAGRLVHIANYLRDLEQDHASGRSPTAGALEQVRNELTLQVLQEVPHVPQLLFSTRFPRCCGSRGALAIIVATTTRFYLRQFRGRVPRSFLRTLWIGVSCTFSAYAYRKLIQQLDAAILDSLSLGNGEAVTSTLKPNPQRSSVRRIAYNQQVFRKPHLVILDRSPRRVDSVLNIGASPQSKHLTRPNSKISTIHRQDLEPVERTHLGEHQCRTGARHSVFERYATPSHRQ